LRTGEGTLERGVKKGRGPRHSLSSSTSPTEREGKSGMCNGKGGGVLGEREGKRVGPIGFLVFVCTLTGGMSKMVQWGKKRGGGQHRLFELALTQTIQRYRVRSAKETKKEEMFVVQLYIDLGVKKEEKGEGGKKLSGGGEEGRKGGEKEKPTRSPFHSFRTEREKRGTLPLKARRGKEEKREEKNNTSLFSTQKGEKKERGGEAVV